MIAQATGHNRIAGAGEVGPINGLQRLHPSARGKSSPKEFQSIGWLQSQGQNANRWLISGGVREGEALGNQVAKVVAMMTTCNGQMLNNEITNHAEESMGAGHPLSPDTSRGPPHVIDIQRARYAR